MGKIMPKKNQAAVAEPVAIIDGMRTPFLRSGTGFTDKMAYELGALATSALIAKTKLPPETVDNLVMGTTVHEVRTHNVAREVSLAAGLPHAVRSHTVSAACVSANYAMCNVADSIYRAYAQVGIAGGVESLSDVPIQFQQKMRRKFMAMRKAKTVMDYVKLFGDVRPKDLAPEMFAIIEWSTGLNMGENGDRLAKRLDISRDDQDAFAVRSHALAVAAQESGVLADEIAPVEVGGKTITGDNGPRAGTTPEKVAKLRPAFSKDGTITAANSSFLTDGGAAVLLMHPDKAKEFGLKPKALLRSYAMSGTDPLEELLLGPAYATPWALDRAGLTLADIDVLEIHEAFAVQMLAVIRLLESDAFAKEKLGRTKAVGKVDWDKLNTLGGSLSLGHPFGATGARLVTTCVNRLIREDGQFGLVAACGAGGCGNAMVIERV
jgi:acetyl-CoA acetyltransferase family protein